MKPVLLTVLTVFSFVAVNAQKLTPEQAARRVGDSVQVCGRIYGGRFFETSSKSPTLLNMGDNYPKAPLTITIYGDVRSTLGYVPEVELKDKEICVRGTVRLFRGKPELVVFTASQIEY